MLRRFPPLVKRSFGIFILYAAGEFCVKYFLFSSLSCGSLSGEMLLFVVRNVWLTGA